MFILFKSFALFKSLEKIAEKLSWSYLWKFFKNLWKHFCCKKLTTSKFSLFKIRKNFSWKYTGQKWSFPSRIFLVNGAKPVNVSCGFGRIYWRNPQWRSLVFRAVGLTKARLLFLTIFMTSELWVSESSLFLPIVVEERKYVWKNHMVSISLFV